MNQSRIPIFFFALFLSVTLMGCKLTDSIQQERDIRFSQTAILSEPHSHALRPDSISEQVHLAATAGRNNVVPQLVDGVAPLPLLEAIELALANSNLVRVATGDSVAASRNTFYDIQSAEAQKSRALAAFDSSFEASIFARDIKRPPNAFFGPGLLQPLNRDEATFNFGIVKPTVTGAIWRLGYDPDPSYFFVSNPSSTGFNPIRNTNATISANQPLLRGAGRAINLIPVQITQIGIEQSTWQFKKSIIDSVQGVITSYWELYAARAAVLAIDEVLPQLNEIVRLQEEALKAGWVVEADVAKAKTQLHDFKQQKLNLQAAAIETELRLRNLVGLAPDLSWIIVPETQPVDVELTFSCQEQLQQSMLNQPDIVQQRLNIRIRHLEQMLADNQMKPNFDISALYRLNGLGENLGDALDQLATLDFRDFQIGATFSTPLGRRAATAEAYSANRQLMKETELLQQEVISVYQDLVRTQQRMDFAFRQFREAELRARSADTWVKGARLRYQNPNRDNGGDNWLLETLNDYLNAIRFKTNAETDRAALLAEYNIELARLESIKGTLLDFFGVQFLGDPCRQAQRLPTDDLGLKSTTSELEPAPKKGKGLPQPVKPSLKQASESGREWISRETTQPGQPTGITPNEDSGPAKQVQPMAEPQRSFAPSASSSRYPLWEASID
jgi:outer membrane protein TolC